MIKMIGLEAEYVLLNPQGEPVMMPHGWDQDSMPLLGEIRGEPNKTWDTVVASFNKALLRTRSDIEKRFPGHKMMFASSMVVNKALLKEATRTMDLNEKERSLDKVRNTKGISITDYSDQVIVDGKITGTRLSCGLHVHFSYSVRQTKKIERAHYEAVQLPLQIGIGDKPLLLDLYKKVSEKEETVVSVETSKFTRPAVHFIVNEMDTAFFDRFAPVAEKRTKYRHPGFYETKPYGFEYRSLPANEETISCLPEIVKHSFAILNQLDDY